MSLDSGDNLFGGQIHYVLRTLDCIIIFWFGIGRPVTN